MLIDNGKLVKEITLRKKRIANYKERAVEKSDPDEIIQEKALKLAEIVAQSEHLVSTNIVDS